MASDAARERYLLADGLRGLAVVNMVAYHFLYDVMVVLGRNPRWYALPPVHLWQQGICWSFILIAGFSWQLGRAHNLRRGLLLNFWGLVITGVTLIALPSEAIWFGILNFIGCAVLLTVPLDRALSRLPAGPGAAVSFLLFLLFKPVQRGYLGLGSWELLRLPEGLYSLKLLTPLGFPYPGFRSSDFFPLLPWFFLFLTGYFFYGLFLRRKRWRRAALRPLPLLTPVGQTSLLIYLLHQPLCLLIAWLFFR